MGLGKKKRNRMLKGFILVFSVFFSGTVFPVRRNEVPKKRFHENLESSKFLSFGNFDVETSGRFSHLKLKGEITKTSECEPPLETG